MSDLMETPLAQFVANYLHEDWTEDATNLQDVLYQFIKESTSTQVDELKADIAKTLLAYGDAKDWPIELWPFDEDETPPKPVLAEIVRVLE